jgi:hypothetical protein
MTSPRSTNGGTTSTVFERLAALEAENDQLRTALQTRIIIEQAKGAISVRCGVNPETAFELMRIRARGQQRKIHEYAAEIVANGGRLAVEGEDGQVAKEPIARIAPSTLAAARQLIRDRAKRPIRSGVAGSSSYSDARSFGSGSG